MKRTIALVLSLIFMLVLVPTTALADNDVGAYLDVKLSTVTPPKTLFQYGTDPFDWTSASLVVKLYDNTPTNAGGTLLPTMGTAIAAGTYVLYMNGAIYNPATPYAFQIGDLGKKTVKIVYSYIPTGHTNAITLEKDLTISVQKSILNTITPSDLIKTDYYVGETLSLTGLTVKAAYTNVADPVTLASDAYTVFSATDETGANRVEVGDPLTAALIPAAKLVVSKTEKYDGSDTEVTKTGSLALTVHAAASSLELKEGGVAISTKDMVVGSAATTISATVDAGSTSACLVASVDKPAVAAIDTSTLTGSGTLTITPLSVGQAVVTVRTRGSNISKTIVVNVTKPNVPVASVSLDRTSLMLPVNGTYSLTATVGPDDATNKTINWASSSPSDVSVDSTGTVKVLRDFPSTKPVTITATTVSLPAITQTCSVTVNTVAVDGISLSDTSITLYKGSYKTIAAVVTPSGAADPAVTWSSSDTNIATVDSTGKITAKGLLTGKDYGDCVITAQTSNSTVMATVNVHVLSAVLVTSLTLNKSDLALNVGDEETLTVTGTPSNATNKTLLWTSSNKDVATVTASGKITAAGKGTAVIKAEATDGSGKYVSCVVTVNNIQVLNVSLDKSSFDLSEGDTAAIKATIYPTNATNQTLKWTSSNSSVATVDSKGNITAGATKGYAIITAAATDGSGKSAECVVLSKPKIAITGLTINYGAALDILQGDATYLKATILPSNATTQTVTWSTTDSNIASIDANGLLRGVKLGEATITAKGDTKTVTIKVTVTNTEYNYGVAANFGRRVNVRSSASGLSKLVGYAYLGDTFKILGKTGNWYYIQYNNTTKGYIWANYLNATKTSAGYTPASTTSTSPGSPTPAPGTTTTPTKLTIANCVYAVNVRTSASTSSKRLGKASLGSTYTYLGAEGDWYKIQYNTTTIGYVYKTFASLS
ncbi:MAG: Ig-like domain-containing protein [Christensenella sp.]|nr:Ig-like domain-containing protein [Christensenella sp.]